MDNQSSAFGNQTLHLLFVPLNSSFLSCSSMCLSSSSFCLRRTPQELQRCGRSSKRLLITAGWSSRILSALNFNPMRVSGSDFAVPTGATSGAVEGPFFTETKGWASDGTTVTDKELLVEWSELWSCDMEGAAHCTRDGRYQALWN